MSETGIRTAALRDAGCQLGFPHPISSRGSLGSQGGDAGAGWQLQLQGREERGALGRAGEDRAAVEEQGPAGRGWPGAQAEVWGGGWGRRGPAVGLRPSASEQRRRASFLPLCTLFKSSG